MRWEVEAGRGHFLGQPGDYGPKGGEADCTPALGC